MWASSKKAFAVFSVVLLAVSFSLSAFSFFSRSEAPKELEIQEEVKQQASVQDPVPEQILEVEAAQVPSKEASEALPPQSLSEADSETESTKLSSLLESLETQRRMDQKQLTALIEVLNEVKADYDIVMADSEEKQDIIDELSAANAKQADDLAYLRGRYDRAVSSKFFMNTGLALGFKGETPTYGIVGNFGMRIGSGLLLGAGAQVMAGSFKEVPFSNWSLDDLSIQLTVGWEW